MDQCAIDGRVIFQETIEINFMENVHDLRGTIQNGSEARSSDTWYFRASAEFVQ